MLKCDRKYTASHKKMCHFSNYNSSVSQAIFTISVHLKAGMNTPQFTSLMA